MIKKTSQTHDLTRRSRWMLRLVEWNDAKASHPHVWLNGMPLHVLALNRVAGRVRLGDLIAIYYPDSEQYPERANKFLGLSRVVGLRKSENPSHAWIDLETAHRIHKGLTLDQSPRLDFLCCDPEWPDLEVQLFQGVFDAAVADGWKPRSAEIADTVPEVSETADRDRSFGGASYCGDMRDPQEETWLATVSLRDDRLRVTRLCATGRRGLQLYLTDPDQGLGPVEAVGLDFAFSFPVTFFGSAADEAGGKRDGWLMETEIKTLSRPDFLERVHDFRQAQGDLKRFTDESAQAPSPLQRDDRDLSSMTYHGVRMLAEGRSGYVVRPFESAEGKPLLEVYPGGVLRKLGFITPDGKLEKLAKIVAKLGSLTHLPIDITPNFVQACKEKWSALDAVMAARTAASAMLSGEAQQAPEELAPDQAGQVRIEGWIYGMNEPG